MKKIAIIIAITITFVFSNEKLMTCDVVEKGIVKCSLLRKSKDGFPIIDEIVYHFKKDGSYVRKILQGGNQDEEWEKSRRQVMTSVLAEPERWPCLEKDPIGSYSVADGDCFNMESRFVSKIMKGEKFQIFDTNGNDPFENMGEQKIVSWTICSTPTNVTTSGIHKITRLATDMKIYSNLKPSTHCQDFMATDALYWKP